MTGLRATYGIWHASGAMHGCEAGASGEGCVQFGLVVRDELAWSARYGDASLFPTPPRMPVVEWYGRLLGESQRNDCIHNRGWGWVSLDWIGLD